MLSRRGFLLSSAGIITSLFLSRLYAHIEEFEEPLLLTPPIVADTLYISNDEQGLVALGSRNIDQPEQPTLSWLKFAVICPLPSGPSTILVWTMKEKRNGQEAPAGGDYRQAA